MGQLWSEVCYLDLNTDWRSVRASSGVRFVIGIWLQTEGLSGKAVEWGLWLRVEYRLTERETQLLKELCDWVLNTDWRNEWDECGVIFVIGPWIQSDGESEGLWSEVCDWVVNTDWPSVWDDCWVWFVTGESIHTDGVSGTTVERSLWLDWEQRLTDWVGRLWSEVCVWTENTDLRIQWAVCWVRFVICLWIQIDGVCGMTFEWNLLVDIEYRLKEWVWKLWSEVCDWNVNTDWRS
jgi:hypothetical protein